MNVPDDRLEHLISRKLDGELSEGEALELDKSLIRDVDARRYFEEVAKIDVWAAEELNRACVPTVQIVPPERSRTWRGRRSAWWALVPAAAAACIALWLAWPTIIPRRTASVPVAENHAVSDPIAGPQGRDLLPEPDVRLANYRAEPARQTGTTVDYYGLFDQGQDKLYLLEVKQTRSRQRNDGQAVSTPQGRVMLTSGDM